MKQPVSLYVAYSISDKEIKLVHTLESSNDTTFALDAETGEQIEIKYARLVESMDLFYDGKPVYEKVKQTRPPTLYQIIREILSDYIPNVNYHFESRKGWTRVKFMQFHATLTASQIREALERIQFILPKNKSKNIEVSHYRGDCHGPYDAIVLKVRK